MNLTTHKSLILYIDQRSVTINATYIYYMYILYNYKQYYKNASNYALSVDLAHFCYETNKTTDKSDEDRLKTMKMILLPSTNLHM